MNGTLSPLEKAAVRSTMRQVAQAISYTHQQGIVHRDIKPENVLLQGNGNIALCDFGISKDIISNKYESTMILSAVGTAAYCAPEAGNHLTWLSLGTLQITMRLRLPKVHAGLCIGSACAICSACT